MFYHSVTVEVRFLRPYDGARVRDFWESGGFLSSLVDSVVLAVFDMTSYPDEDD